MRNELYHIAFNFPLADQLYLQGIALLGSDEEVAARLYEAEARCE